MDDFDREQDTNLTAFEGMLGELLRTDPGRVVLIQRGERIKVFDNLTAALTFGVEHFGEQPYLVHEIRPLLGVGDPHLECRP